MFIYTIEILLSMLDKLLLDNLPPVLRLSSTTAKRRRTGLKKFSDQVHEQDQVDEQD